MRILAVILVVLLALVAALFALGVIGSGPAPQLPPSPGTPPGTEPVPGGAATLARLAPDQEPPIEAFPIEEDLHVLLLARYAERVPAALALWWGINPKVKVTAWVPPPPAGGGSGAPPPEALRGATVLDGPPPPTFLDEQAVDVLALHGFEPGELPDAFWTAAAERIAGGRMGLLAMPGRPEGQALLDHPVLGGLLPIERAAPMEGTPLPGVLGGDKPLEVTDEGVAHPASRLVEWPRWSRSIWRARTSGDAAWGTSICWPVEAVKEGATTLLLVTPSRGSRIPALVVGPEAGGRVLWFGAFDLMPRTGYGRPEVVEALSRVLTNWLAWLAGRVAD